MSDDNDILVETEDFQSWYDGDQVGIEFLADGVTKVIHISGSKTPSRSRHASIIIFLF